MPLPYLAGALRTADHDRYLISLFAPRERREALWALFLFNHEIAKTREVVSDTTLGLIRLQWWRDEIGKLYDGGSGGQNQVLSTLGQAIRTYDLPLDHFETLIYAREFDLEDVAPANLDGLRHYADFTTTPLTKLALKIAGESEEEDIIRGISIHYAVLGIIRSVPFMLQHRRCYLPQDILVSYNVSPQKLFDNNEKEAIIQAIKAIILSFDSYRKPKSVILRKMRKASLIYLKQLKKSGCNPFSHAMQKFPPFFALRLALS